METFDVEKALAAQEEYCKKESLPNFVPNGGRCWHCHRNVFTPTYWKKKPGTSYEYEQATADDYDKTIGVSVEKAGKSLITGCPHCNRSYCD